MVPKIQQAHRGALAVASLLGVIRRDAISSSFWNDRWFNRWFQQSNLAVSLSPNKSYDGTTSLITVPTVVTWGALLVFFALGVMVITEHTVNVS